MKNLSVQRQPHREKRSPWKRRLLLVTPPLGCSIAGAAICGKEGPGTTKAAVGAKETPGGRGIESLNGAAAGLVIGIIAAHAIRWLKRKG